MTQRALNLSLAAMMLATPAVAEEITVTMAGHTYDPAEITASVGDVLRFVNDDTDAHNVFVPSAGYALDLGKQEPGTEAALTLRKAGAFEVECVIHPGMLAMVEVQ
jgi:plastocyanin